MEDPGDLDWIFAHGAQVLADPQPASITALAESIGWLPPSGEGYAYWHEADIVLIAAWPSLINKDRRSWDEMCRRVRR